jgi:hypothetical protein
VVELAEHVVVALHPVSELVVEHAVHAAERACA